MAVAMLGLCVDAASADVIGSSGFLSKKEARRVAAPVAYQWYESDDEATDYSADAAEDCSRRSSRQVRCAIAITRGDGDGICVAKIEVTKRSSGQMVWRKVALTDGTKTWCS